MTKEEFYIYNTGAYNILNAVISASPSYSSKEEYLRMLIEVKKEIKNMIQEKSDPDVELAKIEVGNIYENKQND